MRGSEVIGNYNGQYNKTMWFNKWQQPENGPSRRPNEGSKRATCLKQSGTNYGNISIIIQYQKAEGVPP